MACSIIFAAVWASIAAATEVSVMLPLDAITNDGKLKDPDGLKNQLHQLKDGGVDGVMSDVWWGITEPEPNKYNFDAYKSLVAIVKEAGLKLQLVTSFHACGGGVGDDCNIPLPAFVKQNNDIFYKDQDGNVDQDYVSLFADFQPVASAGGRTPLDMYSDWFKAFVEVFGSDLGATITEMQVGLGPAGELRFPAYQLRHWKFCGVGAFQSYDKYALASLANASSEQKKPDFFGKPPSNAGDYNSQPKDADFWQEGKSNNYASDYGKFFMGWYSGALERHAVSVLALARAAFPMTTPLSMKIAGIHWWYNAPHHAAELTAGYYNTNMNDAYKNILVAVSDTKELRVDFTCMEMRDREQSSSCASSPESLVKQVQLAAKAEGRAFSGENALARYDDTAYQQIESYKSDLLSFTYLRLSPTLLQGDNFGKFKNFVNQMHNKQSRDAEMIV